jgi:hypothetical protein
MHSDHFLGLVEARFRAKYDDRVLLAERPIIVAAPEAAEMARDAGAQGTFANVPPSQGGSQRD